MTRSRSALVTACRVARLPHRALLAGALALAAASAPGRAEAVPQGDADTAGRVRELYRKGREEMAKEGHLPQAYDLLHEAWGLQKSHDIAGNLAQVEIRLTRYREAAEHASYALANLPAGASDAQLKALQDVLSSARAHLGTITLRVSVDHAQVTLDGLPLGESPIASEIFVEPGRHTFFATFPGCEPAKDAVRADKGGNHLLTLTFTKCGDTPLPKPPLVAPQGPRPLTVAGIVVTGVGLGLGAAFAILSKVKGDQADQKLQSIEAASHNDPNACAGASPSSDCTTLYDLRRSHDTFANAAIGTFVAAGVVGVGTLVYAFAVPTAPAPVKAGQARVIPVVGPGAGALVVKGAF